MTTPALVRTVVLSLAVIALALIAAGVFLALRHAEPSLIVSVFGLVAGPVTGMCALLSNNSGHTSTAIGAGATATQATEPKTTEDTKGSTTP